MDKSTLRRNTIVLSAFPSRTGKSTSYANIEASVCEHYPPAQVNNALADLIRLGYIEQTDHGYARIKDACSVTRKAVQR